MKIAVIDGRGGGIGKSLIERLRKVRKESVEIIALGTNETATAEMIKAGADYGFSGKDAILEYSCKADIITGPIAILIPDSIKGEITPEMAFAIGSSEAPKYLVPLNRCGVFVPGVKNRKVQDLIDSLVDEIP